MYIPLTIVDPERFEVDFPITEPGLYKVHIKCNSVMLPKSPFIIVAISGSDAETGPKMECMYLYVMLQTECAIIFSRIVYFILTVPIFQSDASKVTCRGLGLSHILLNEKNEFTIDASAAGNNILFVGIFGPKGQCDEVIVKHMGKNVYKVTYEVQDPGEYLLAAKWGDDHIMGSPFSLSAN